MPFSTSTRSTAAACRSQRGWSFGTTQNRIGIAIPLPASHLRPLVLPSSFGPGSATSTAPGRSLDVDGDGAGGENRQTEGGDRNPSKSPPTPEGSQDARAASARGGQRRRASWSVATARRI